MARRRLMVCMLVAVGAVTNSARAQSATEFAMLEAPAYGVVRSLPGNEGVAYVGVGNQPDAFCFAAADEWGTSLIEVAVDPLLGTAGIRTVDFGGPVAYGAQCAFLRKRDDQQPPPPPATPEREFPDGFAVIVYVDQPGLGGDRDVVEMVNGRPDVGHVFIEVINGEVGQSITIGFYPKDVAISPLFPHDDGEIRDDRNHPWDVQLEIEISDHQLDQLLIHIEADLLDPRPYDLNDNNCADYVLGLLEGVGIEIESQQGSWILGGGNNPGDLGQDLLPLGGKTNPNPVVGGGGSSSRLF